MILLDAYGVLALARGEDAADEIEQLVSSDEITVSVANYFEAADQLMRLSRWSAEETYERFALLFGGPVRVAALDERTAWRGALLRAEYYDREACELSLADCVLLATADPDYSIATADPAIAAVARAEGIELVPLPDSSGQRP